MANLLLIRSKSERPMRCAILILVVRRCVTVSSGANAVRSPQLQAPREEERAWVDGDQTVRASGVLAQLNGALEGLAAKSLSGGGADSGHRLRAAARGRSIADRVYRSAARGRIRRHRRSNGYIMTTRTWSKARNAFAWPCRCPWAIPPDRCRSESAGYWKPGCIGQHKETDLALLKIEETDLPTLPLISQRGRTSANSCLPSAVRKACRIRSPWAWSVRSRVSPIPPSRLHICRPMLPSIPATAAARWLI